MIGKETQNKGSDSLMRFFSLGNTLFSRPSTFQKKKKKEVIFGKNSQSNIYSTGLTIKAHTSPGLSRVINKPGDL